MITFICCISVLVLGYFLYGRFVQHVFKPDDRPTPAMVHNDGVDYVPMKKWRTYLVELLNIAGTGPIFGALMGAVFGPVVFLWIVFGSILGGAVHDYMCGMISVRRDGASIAEIVGDFLGKPMRYVVRVFSIVLLILVGAVFTTSPAVLIADLTPEWMDKNFWVIVITAYYVIATLLPIDKIIGKLYPVFGAVLIIMVIGVMGGLVFGGYTLPELTLENLNPTGKPVWPYMFITVACGAISGFHSTQAPLMARCIRHEKEGKAVFYGAMLSESVIAMVWAAAGVAFYGTTGGLENALESLGQSGVVYDICVSLLGVVGGVLAVIGVVVCPVSSGDTAYRSARLTIADWFHIDQSKFTKRLATTIPILAVGAVLTQLDFDVVWRYFSWANQALAMIALWAISVYLLKNAEKQIYSLVSVVPAVVMTGVSFTYIMMADEGFRIPQAISYPAGAGISVLFLGLFAFYVLKYRRNEKRISAAK